MPDQVSVRQDRSKSDIVHMQNLILPSATCSWIVLGGVPNTGVVFLRYDKKKKTQYRCHLNNIRNATLLERGLFSLLHFGEDTALCY